MCIRDRCKCFFYLIYGVTSADDLQCLLVHGLGIDGDSVNAVIQQHLKLLSGDAVRSARFHGKFLQMLRIKLTLDPGQQTVQLIRL